MKCPWYIHYDHNENFDTIKKLDEHLQTHEARFVSRRLAELIAKIEGTAQEISDSGKFHDFEVEELLENLLK